MFAILIAIVIFLKISTGGPSTTISIPIYTTLLLVNKVDEAIC